jgi:hypothetical protein
MPPRIEGAEQIVERFGHWPSFHDNAIEELCFSGNDCVLRIAAWEMSEEVDTRGTFKTRTHCRVSFHFRDVSLLEVNIELPSGQVVLSMHWDDQLDGSVTARWQPAAGSASAIRARSCSVTVE